MLIPGADKVHPRRLTWSYCRDTLENEGSVKQGQQYRGEFEKQFGYPTDIDAVWEARVKQYHVSVCSTCRGTGHITYFATAGNKTKKCQDCCGTPKPQRRR